MFTNLRNRLRWAAPVSLIVALILSVLGTASASAVLAAPGGLTPNASSAPVSANPALTWNRVSGAASYEVEVSTGSDFSSTVYRVSTTNRRVVPTNQLPVGVVWWRVRSLDSARVAGPWAVASFERSAVAGPTLLSPADQLTLTQPDRPPVLTWSPVAGATSYRVEIDGAERDWVDSTTYSTSTTSLVVPNPQEDGTYWWRVRADLGAGISTLPSAQEWSYSVGPLPVVGPADLAQPDLMTSPLEGETVRDVVFDWRPVDGAVSYDIRVSTNDAFDSTGIIDQQVVKGTRYSPKQTYKSDDYWWQVRARNIFGKAQQWNDVRIRQFHREWNDCRSGACTLAQPKAVHPAASDPSVNDDPFYFQWSPVPLASRYQLDVGTDPNFSPKTFNSCYTTQTTYAAGYVAGEKWPNMHPDPCMPAQGTPHYWRVKALDGPRSPEVESIYSEPVKFYYDSGVVEQQSPQPGATVDVPTLSWKPSQDAEKYKVTITGPSFVSPVETASYSYTPRTKLAPGTYSWTVQAIDRNGGLSPAPMNPPTFTLSGTVPTTGASYLQPLSPGDASESPRFPSLSWEPYPNADHYKVHIADAGTVYWSDLVSYGTTAAEFDYPAATDTSATYLKPGNYDWYVSAYTSTGVRLGDGQVSTFTIRDLAPVTGQRLALDASGLDGSPCTASWPDKCENLKATPILDWDPVPDAGLYMIYLSRDRQFTNMVWGTKTSPLNIPATQNTRWNPATALDDSQAGMPYYWYIRPCKTREVCAPDPTEANNVFEKRSNKVDGLDLANKLQPLPGETVPAVANEVTFSWRDYLTTNQDTAKDPVTGKPVFANPVTNEYAGQAAKSYHLQVGTTAAFPTPLVDDVVIDQPTYTAFAKTYPEGQLFWRVQAIDGTGNGLAWSDAQEFVKRSPRVELTSTVRPANGGTARTDQTFRWNALRFAASYDVEVYRNNDTAASSINRVITANSKQVAYSSTTLLPVAADPYVWRVRPVDADGNKGAWSDWWSFKVVGGAPNLLGPEAGASVVGNDAWFTWQAVEGAATYKLERRQSGASYAAETVTTAALSYATTSTLAAGTWEWRVTALNGAGKQIGISDWRSFSVPSSTTTPTDTRRPYVVSKSPVTYAKRRSNFVAKFSEPVYNLSGKTMQLYMKGRTTPVSASVRLSADRKTATLNPSRDLRLGKVYILKLRSGIRDKAGNHLTATSWQAKVR